MPFAVLPARSSWHLLSRLFALDRTGRPLLTVLQPLFQTHQRPDQPSTASLLRDSQELSSGHLQQPDELSSEHVHLRKRLDELYELGSGEELVLLQQCAEEDQTRGSRVGPGEGGRVISCGWAITE